VMIYGHNTWDSNKLLRCVVAHTGHTIQQFLGFYRGAGACITTPRQARGGAILRAAAAHRCSVHYPQRLLLPSHLSEPAEQRQVRELRALLAINIP
jgi:hypothetical protein